MDKPDTQKPKGFPWTNVLRNLFLYVPVPVLLLVFLAKPVGDAVRSSEAAALWILLAALTAVGLNWMVYTVLHRRRPSLLVFAYGVFCLLLVVIVEAEALPAYEPLASTLAIVGGALALAFCYLLSFWLAPRRSKVAHLAAVGLWIIIGVAGVFMTYQVIRDFEIRNVTRDTWITLLILAAMVLAAFSPRILASRRREASRSRAGSLVTGKIVQMVGETHLDRDDDLVTEYHARVLYTVDGIEYETRASISGITLRRFGRKAFVGKAIPVFYDPADPAYAFADPIDRHFFDSLPAEPSDNQDSIE